MSRAPRLSDAECYAQVAAASELGVMGEKAARDDVIASFSSALSVASFGAGKIAVSFSN
jgi:hypothetical protein